MATFPLERLICSAPIRVKEGSGWGLNASRPLFGSRRAQHETLDDAAIVRIAEPPVEPL